MQASHVVRPFQWATAIAAVVGLFWNAPLFADGGPQGRRRMMGGASHMADMSLIHELPV